MLPWQRNRLALVVTVATAFFGIEFSASFIPLFVRYLGVSDLGDAALWSGVVVGVAPLATALMGPLWGHLADRFGAKPLVLRALVVISALSFALGAAPSVEWLAVIRALMGLLSGFTPLAMALAVSITPRERVGQTVGLMQAAQLLPQAIGPPLGGLILDAFGPRANFYLTGAVVALAIPILVVLLNVERRASPPTRAVRQRTGSGRLLALPGLLVLLALIFLSQFVDRSLGPILPLYLAHLNTPESQLATISGLVVAVGAVAMATSATLYGRLARPGRTAVLLAAALTAGTFCVAPLALADRWEQVLVLRLAGSLLAGGVVAMAYTLGTRLVPAEQTGLALGLLSSSAMVASAGAPFLAGLLGRLDLKSVFLVDAACYLTAAILALTALRPAERSTPRSSRQVEPSTAD